jgi:hypothetical protein
MLPLPCINKSDDQFDEEQHYRAPPNLCPFHPG